MRASTAVSIVALVVTAGAVWYFRDLPLGAAGKKPEAPVSGVAQKSERASLLRGPGVVELAPADLPGLAAFLAQVPLDQRGQFVREKVATLSAAQAEDREKIRAFLRSGADVEIEHPTEGGLPLDAGRTTLRRYFLSLLEKFPAAEGVPLAREVLATTGDFRESYLCLAALEKFQPDANRADAAAAMQRALAAVAARPMKSGRDGQAYIEEYDRFAEPLAQYALVELHPQALRVVQANPTLVGRYTQAIESYPAAAQAAAYRDLFAQSDVAQELMVAAETRSANVWSVPAFREGAARTFASQMAEGQRVAFIQSLGEETGLHFEPKPLAAVTPEPVLKATDPAKDVAQAQDRLKMLDTVAPLSTTPATKTALAEARAAIQAEIDDVPTLKQRGKTLPLPVPSAFGDPVGVADQVAAGPPGTTPKAGAGQ